MAGFVVVAVVIVDADDQGNETRASIGRVPVDAGVRLLDAGRDPQATPRGVHDESGARRAEHAAAPDETPRGFGRRRDSSHGKHVF